MITYNATKSETVIVSGLVVLQLRFESDSEVMYPLSPRGARYLARLLSEAADEADSWRAPDERDNELDAQGVARLDDEPAPAPRLPKQRRRRARKTKG